MPAELEPLRRVKCTYADCYESFETLAAMKSHKKYSDEHDYCHKCDLDFVDFADFAFHKLTRPDNHDKACRVCGDEFKSGSGLRRHTELSHKIDQKLVCLGCHVSFPRAFLLVEHLEFGHCDVISASQFQGHIVHKHLITELLKGGDTYLRFQAKQAKFEAALDCEEDGGVNLENDMFDDEEIGGVKYQAIKPDPPPATSLSSASAGPYPPLPSQKGSVNAVTTDLVSTLDKMSLGTHQESSTVVKSHRVSPFTKTTPTDSLSGHSHQEHTTASISRQPKVWGSRSGKSASNMLFPNAKPTPAPSEFSIAAYDDKMEQEHGLNIMKTRFWDPMSRDFNPDRFYDAVLNKYNCPFVCEQSFPTPTDLNKHILNDHRITRMKCPKCLKYFKSATALLMHCEALGTKCEINKADDFSIFLDRLSGGFLGVRETTRPDHVNNPSSFVTNGETGRIEHYRPPVATYLQYVVTKPPDWKEPVQAKMVGGIPSKQQHIQW